MAAIDSPADKAAAVGAALAQAFEVAALPIALTPLFINRFILSRVAAPDPVLVLGGAGAATYPDGVTRNFTNPIIAITFPKNVAVDLLLHLEKVFEVSEQDRAEGAARNPHLFGGK
jgi:hypothetical protein